MADQTPSVGRIVHYVAFGTPGGEFQAGAHRAAIITEVYDLDREPWSRDSKDVDLSIAGLCVLNPNGMYFNTYTPYDPSGQKPGTWHWPERV